LFIQNRSAVSGNNVSGTALSRRWEWTDWTLTTPESIKARQKCSALIHDGRAHLHGRGHQARVKAADGGTPLRATAPLRKVFVTTRFTGRVGNLLFGLGAVIGVASRLSAFAPTEAFALNPPSQVTVPAGELFVRFPNLTKHVRLHDDGTGEAPEIIEAHHTLFASANPRNVQQCKPCTFTLKEERANAFELAKLYELEAWVQKPPKGCVVGLVELRGYFQSFKYFRPSADNTMHSALAIAPTTQSEADAILEPARRSVPSGLVVGVQVRLGDKVKGDLAPLYAATDWEYYRVAMRHLAAALGNARSQQGTPASVAFVVTAGGTMNGSSADVALARAHLSSASEHIFFSDARSPHVDLALLRSCDGLVLSSSTLGWWAAYLSRLPAGHVVTPRHTISPKLSSNHPLVSGFEKEDYIPEEWLILDNLGNGTVKGAFDEEKAQNQLDLDSKSLAAGGLKLNASTGTDLPGSSQAVQLAFMAARRARAAARLKATQGREIRTGLLKPRRPSLGSSARSK